MIRQGPRGHLQNQEDQEEEGESRLFRIVYKSSCDEGQRRDCRCFINSFAGQSSLMLNISL